jgi:hypothetical protein
VKEAIEKRNRILKEQQDIELIKKKKLSRAIYIERKKDWAMEQRVAERKILKS